MLLAYIQGIIETLGLILLVLVFSRVEIKWGRSIVASMVITAIILGIRHLPIVPGMHLAVSVILLFVFVAKMTKAPKSGVFMAVFISYFCLAGVEYSLNQLFISLNILHAEDVTESSNVWMMIGYIQAIVLNLLALLIQLIVKSKYLWKKKEDGYMNT